MASTTRVRWRPPVLVFSILAAWPLVGIIVSKGGTNDAALRTSASEPRASVDSAPLEAARRDPATRVRLGAEFERLKQQSRKDLAQQLARPHLPETQRPLWIAAWNRMRECAMKHGFQGVSGVQPTYGDGKTPTPIVDLDYPNAQTALRACPLDGAH
jgi:hypothetical protein